MAVSKGHLPKTVNISFDPPSFGTVSFLGFSIPVSKVSLPKLEIAFEIFGGEQAQKSTSKEEEESERVADSSSNNNTAPRVDTLDMTFSFHYPGCGHLNESVSAGALLVGNAICESCETVFKANGLNYQLFANDLDATIQNLVEKIEIEIKSV